MSLNAMRAFWERQSLLQIVSAEQIEELKSKFNVAEEIRPVVKAPGYAVSFNGRVFTFLTTTKTKERPREMKPIPHCGGYRMVRFQINRRPSASLVHTLVAEAFLPPPTAGQDRCRHLDGDPANNNADNLAWGTQAENMQDMIRHGRSLKGTKNTQAKLNDNRVRLIRGLVAEGFSTMVVAGFFGVDMDTVRRIITGEQWGHVVD